jgi:YD repeat-containing protein
MVAIGTGMGVGLERSSASIIGPRGQIGTPLTGRGGDNAFVNAANGNLVITRQDEFLVGLGPDIAISRTYNSQSSVGDGDNNDQWRMSPYRQIIGANGAANITRVDWDGSETVYFQYAANVYASYDGAGAHDWITWTGTQWNWTDANTLRRETYDATGKLLINRDADGNILTYTYTASNLLASITDQNGEHTDFVYGGVGGAQLQQITTVSGTSSVRVHYSYDGSNRLSTVTVDLSPGKTYVTTYTYDGASKRVASIAQSDGSLLQIGYAYTGTDYRVVSLTETVATGVTRVTGLYYDIPNRVTRITDPAGGVTTMSYDAKGNLTQIVMPVPAPGAAAPTIAYTYSAIGDLLSMTEDGRRTDYEYDTPGNLKLTRDSAGNTIVRTYDGRSQLLTSTQYLTPDPDGAGIQLPSNPVTTRYTYDAGLENHLRFAISAEGDVIEYQYNAAGQLLSTIAYTGQKYDVSSLASDFAPTESTMAAWAAAIADKSTVRRTDTTYDGRGNVWTVTRYSTADAAGAGLLTGDYSRDTYVYSPAGQLLSRVNSGSTAQEVFVYDGLGRLTSATDMANATTTFLFTDTASTLTTTATLASGLTRVAAYNKAGELISITESGPNVSTAVTNYYYDGLGRLRMETNPNNAATYHVYDNASRKVADITADGSMTEYAYDASGRLVKTVGYINKLTGAQIALLDDFTAGGAGGAAAGAQGVAGSPTGTNLIVNGGFDESATGYTTLPNVGRSNLTLPGWIKINSEAYEQVSSGVGGVTATEGSFWLDMDSVAGSGLTTPIGSNLVLNPSFETSAASFTSYSWGKSSTTLPNWVKANAEQFEQVATGNYGVTASNGSYWLELDSIPTTRVTTGNNLLLNPSFETVAAGAANVGYGYSSTILPDWIKANSEKVEQVTSGQLGVTASNGTYWLDMDSVAGTGTYVATGANLLTNGSFDTSASPYTTIPTGRSSSTLPGWTNQSSYQFEQATSDTQGITGTDGGFWLDLDSVPSVDIPYGASLLVNGSFDTSAATYTTTSTGRASDTLPGWTNLTSYQFEQVSAGQMGVTGTDGAFWLDLDSVPITVVPPNLIVNGSFEQSGATYTTTATGRMNTSIPGWTGSFFEQTNSGTNGVAATDGSFFLDSDSGSANMDISQTIANMTAGAHTLKFDYANIAGFVGDEWDSSGTLQVYWNGVLVGTVGTTDSALTTKTFTVGAVNGNNVVRFKEIGIRNGLGVYLDNVRLTANATVAGGNMNISQTIGGLTAGERLQLTFSAANRSSQGSNSFVMYWNEQVVWSSVAGASTTLQNYAVTFNAVAGNNTLRIQGFGTSDAVGASLDKMSLKRAGQTANGGNMDFYQSVPNLAAGQIMKLQFNHANTTTAASGSFDVLWNDVVVAQYNSINKAMVTESLDLTAIAGTNKLRFRGTGTADAQGGAIDNVRLFATTFDANGGNLDISQTVTGLTAGQIMRLQFDHANRTTAASGSFDVYWNGGLVAQISSTGTTMLSKSYDVTALAGSNTLRFVGTGTVDAAGASIDNVRLFATQMTPNGGNMDISQGINGLTAGQTYQFQFDHANTTTAASGSFDVYWNTTRIAQISSTGTTMVPESYFVQAAAGTNTIRFVGTGTADSSGAAIDNVRLFATMTDTNGGNMDFSQTIPNLVAGKAMMLQFDHANRTTAASGSFNVYWNGNLVAAVTSVGTTMLTETFNVTAVGGDNVLRFLGTGTVDAVGASIDNVRLFATQAASSGGGSVTDALSGLRPTPNLDDDRYAWNIYDSADRLIGTIDGSGSVKKLSYDGASRLIETLSYAGQLAAATVNGYKTATPTTLVPPAADPANDRVERNFHRKDGLLLGTLDGEGYLSERIYDSGGLLIETIRYATATAAADRAAGSFATLKAGVTASVNAKDIHNWYVRDGRGLLRGTIDGEGDLTRYHYTAADDVDQQVRGQKLDPATLIASRPTLASLTTAAGGQIIETTNYTRDAAGKVMSEVRLHADGTNWTTLYGYDPAGRLISRTEAATTSEARTFTQRYDARGNLIGELAGEGSAALAALGPNPAAAAVDNIYATRGTIYAYDPAGRLISKTEANGVNAAGNRTSYFYRGNYLAVEANALGEVVEYRYNARGERTDTILYATRISAATLPGIVGGEIVAGGQALLDSLANPALDSVTHLDYNVTGTVKQSIDPLGNATTFGYTAFGEVKTRTDPLEGAISVQTDRLYDRRGLLVSETRDAAAGGLQLKTLYGSDAFGRPSQVTDPSNRVSKTDYDRAGRIAVTTDARNFTQVFGYDGRGNVVSIIDRNQATTTFIYDTFNRKITTTTPGQITTEIKHNAHGQTVSIKDGALRETTYEYDKDGNLKTETDAVSVVQHSYDAAGRRQDTIDARGSKTSYTYDAANRIFTEKVNDGGLGLLTKYEYDAKGQNVKITDPANRVTLVDFDKAGRKTGVVVDSGGLAIRTQYDYDKSGRLRSVTEAHGTTVARVTEYEYDKADRLLRTRVDPTGLNLLTQYSYDKAGNVSRKTDAANGVTTYAYDNENRLTRTLDAEGGVVETFYDNEARIAGMRRYANAGSAAAAPNDAFTISVTPDTGRDEVSAYYYDVDGRLKVSVDATGRPSQYTYDNAGNVLRVTDYAGSISYTVGESLTAVQSRIAALPNPADHRITRTAYDGANRRAYSIDAIGQVTAFGYDAGGNVIKQVRYANLFTGTNDPSLAEMGSWVSTNANAADDRIDRTFYDGASRATLSVNAENYVTQIQYDAAGRVTKRIHHDSKDYSTGDGISEASLAGQIGLPQASAAVTSFAYDSAGRLTDTTNPAGSVTHFVLDKLGQATDIVTAANVAADSSTIHRTFDKAGRVQNETRAFGAPEAATVSYTYDGMGRMRTATDPYNVTREYFYDGTGRCIHEVQPLNASQTAHTYKEYDKFGNLVKLTDPRGNSAYFHYDALDRLVWQTDPEGYVTKTSYSRGDEVASVTRYAVAVSGTTIANPPAVTPNAAIDATTTFERDKLDRLKSVTDAELKTETYTLNAFGDRISVKNRLNGTTTNIFDKRGLLKSETLPVGSTRPDGSSAAVSIVNKYDYDSRGNRITTTEAFGIAGETRVTSFEYDKMDRLKRKIGQSVSALTSPSGTAASTIPTETYNYDARGNLIETVTSWGARTLSYYDDHDRKTAEIQATSVGIGTLSKWDYDLNGNAKAARIYADPIALPVDPGGPAPNSGSAYRETLYTYDANNRRTHSKVVGLQSGEYGGAYLVSDIVLETVYDLAGNVVEERDGRNLSQFFYYDRAGRKIAQVDRERYLTFYTLDGDGNVKTEERFANQVGLPTTGSLPLNLRASVAGGLGDRITNFEYDRNGRRTAETRVGVNGKTLSAIGQVQAAHSADARIVYEYNGLGQVVRKTEANLDFTEFEYDALGRQTAIQSAPYTDYQNSSVRKRTELSYNGLGSVTRSVDKSKTGTADRVTTYTYGAGGRLEQVKDASDFVRNFAYDAAGNVVLVSYGRADSAGVATGEANGYRHDLLGRMTSESMLTFNGSAWIEGVVAKTRYNSFGEITGRGLNSDINGNTYQETYDYDAGGRMWRSTAGDGSVRLYGHDKAGNANLVIASAGDDLSNLTLAGAIGAYAGGGIGVATTATVFDGRGQATAIHELQRQIASGVAGGLITTRRVYNAFGEVRQEIDPFNRTTDFSYNSAGKVTKRELPSASYTTETGAVVTGTRATENYSYDLSGRLIGIEDAYGNDTTRRLLGGTGYGNDGNAIVLAEYHPDDGVATKAVDEFGDVRISTDEILRVTGYTYDKMGRLTELAHAGGLVDSYRYDGLGQRTQHWNSFFGSGVVDRTDYDSQRRVRKFVQASGTTDAVTISTAYSWEATRSTTGLGTFGGWVKTTTYDDRSNNNQSIEVTDYFGHRIAKTDLGGRTYAFSYDKAARVIQQTSNASQNLAFTYFNTGKAATITDSYVNAQYSPNSVQAIFAYDIGGNRTFEGYSKTSYQYDWYTGYTTPYTQSLQSATVTYDELGRMKSFDDTANPVSIDWEYDQVGNVRRVLTTFTPVGLASWMDQSQQTTDRWYTYDSMNRMIQVMGYMANGSIGNDMWTSGGFVEYDKAGQRKSVTNNTMDANYSFGKVREEYTYTAAGQLDYVTQSTAWYYDIMDPNSLGPYSAPVMIADNTRDGLGRLTGHSEYANGVSVFSQSSVYNYLSNITLESTFTKMQDGSTTTTSTSFDYRAETSPGSGVWTGQYQGGIVTHASNSRYSSSSGQTTSQTTNAYVWWDEAKIASTTSTSGTVASSVYSYDENGKLASVSISGNRARTVQFVTDLTGQVMSRTEYSTATDNPKDIYYYFNGLRVGDLGNHGPSETDYTTAISKRGAPPQSGSFDNEYNMPSIHADFDQAFSPIGPSSEGNSHGAYIARDGDTLRTIAVAVWGDADMWYLIGEANGLGAGAILTAGQRVRIPAKVTNIHNNAETFRVYDPNRAIGDNSPSQVSQAKPSARRGGCGMIGTIILIAVAVAITLIIKAPVISLVSGLLQGTALAGAATVIGAAATGAIASVVSQGVGLATGIQEKFSWKGVAMSALSAGVTQGIGGGTLLQGAGKFANDVARGALVSAATQGIAVATGLQKKFDWAGIAVAGVVSGVSGAIGRALPGGPPASVAGHVNSFVSRLGGALAGAATRSAITGTSFGDNVLAVLPDVIGTTIGNLIGEAIITIPHRRAAAEQAEEDAGYAGDGRVSAGEDPADELLPYDGDNYITDGEMTPFEEFEARMAATGVTLEPEDRNNPLMYALSDEIPLEIKRKLWDLYQNDEIEFDRRVGRLPGRAGQYDERRGANGVLQFDEALLRLTGHDRLGSDFGAMLMWADLEEQGHQLDAMAWRMMGRPGGDSPGDEGGMFAYLQVRGMDPTQRGIISYDLGSLATFNVDTVSLRLVAQNELANGALGRENRVNGIEYFGPAGHYHTTFVVAFDTLQTIGRSRRDSYRIAQELAFGSQLPDMVASLDATRLFISPWVSNWEMAIKHSAFHSLPMTAAGTRDMPGLRDAIGREVTGHIAAGRWADAGLAIHALADSYSHTQMERINGRWVEVGYRGGIGHGLAEDGGHGPDNIYRNNWNRSKTLSYVRDLGGRLIDGFVGRTAPARRAQLVRDATSDWMTLYRMSNNEDQMIHNARTYENHQYNMPGGHVGLPPPLPLDQMDVGGNRIPARYERPIRDRMRHAR